MFYTNGNDALREFDNYFVLKTNGEKRWPFGAELFITLKKKRTGGGVFLNKNRSFARIQVAALRTTTRVGNDEILDTRVLLRFRTSVLRGVGVRTAPRNPATTARRYFRQNGSH